VSAAIGTPAAEGEPVEQLSYTDIGERFGVSRTHVRSLLQDAEQAGLVALPGQGGRLVELKAAVLRAFDRFLADSMSGHDLLHRIALGRIAERQPCVRKGCRWATFVAWPQQSAMI
jgi:hypothetical protein